MEPLNAAENPPASKSKADDPDNLDVLDYIQDEYRQYALQEISHNHAISYFLPLVHELFSGSESKTKVVFTILHSLMLDERVRWSRAELDEKFHWLKEHHRNYLLHRLSNVGWLEYYRDLGMYMVSDKAEALMRILNRFVMGPELVQNEGAALAEIEFSQLLECQDITEQLRFLCNRLLKHVIRAERALNSQSPYLILEIYQQLKSAYRWTEQTRNALDHLVIDDDDIAQWDEVQQVHDHLSRLHQLISQMQLELQDIQRKQIDIARYGLTHLDFDNFLIHSRVDVLADMIAGRLRNIPRPILINERHLFAEADGVLKRDRSTSDDARRWDSNVHDVTADDQPIVATEAVNFTKDLTKTNRKWRGIEKLLGTERWEVAAYRFSLLTVIADRDPHMLYAAEQSFDPIVATPVEVAFDPEAEMVAVKGGGETRVLTPGRVRKFEKEEREAQNVEMES